ncbi:MAG: reductive dehalogenase [Desulfobacterales bacterium]|nr:reductive dehalogenase [Bacteroides sp.]MDX2439494.1 reductive dehalogenase [Desulfobacterales bacterium]
MIYFLIIIGVLALTIQAFIGLSFFVSCIWEKEKRATIFALVQFAGMSALLVVFLVLAKNGIFHTTPGFIILVIGYVFFSIAAVLLLKKSPPNTSALKGTKGLIKKNVLQYDERKIVFARNRSLRPDSEEFNTFYAEYPQYKEYDDKRRTMGGPMGNIGTVDNPNADINNAMTFASINMPSYLGDSSKVRPERHPALKQKLGDKKIDITPQEASKRVKGFAKRLGASIVGIAELNPLWVYSKRGEIFYENWEDWGQKIELDHKYIIVFAEEMEFDLVSTAPHTPTNIESMFNYAKGAFISTQLAAFIANLGYSATANHLRHYDSLMVPLAVDAGLGELSRMGYLITKELGPRVRLSAVSTNLPLITDKPVDIGVDHFCEVCKKCAVCCPSASIPDDKKTEVNGTRRWMLNAETCFEYWGKVGTDCNRCMMVCPWSHARTFPHRLIVFMITRNALVRKLFALMDDLFYGRKPKSKAGPDWASYK